MRKHTKKGNVSLHDLINRLDKKLLLDELNVREELEKMKEKSRLLVKVPRMEQRELKYAVREDK